MKICYYAIQRMVIGDEVREEGDLIPEVMSWKQHIRNSYVDANRIAPVLVLSLPKSERDLIEEWEKDFLRLQEIIEVDAPFSELDEENEREAEINAAVEAGDVDFDLDALNEMDSD